MPGRLGVRILVAGLLFLAGCASTESTEKGGSEDREPASGLDSLKTNVESSGVVLVTGTMHLIPVEMGCWQLQLENGTGYELLGQKIDSLKVEGAKVTVKIRPKPNLKSECMVGLVGELIEIVALHRP